MIAALLALAAYLAGLLTLHRIEVERVDTEAWDDQDIDDNAAWTRAFRRRPLTFEAGIMRGTVTVYVFGRVGVTLDPRWSDDDG